MTTTWVVPRIWVAGERVSATKMNEISTDFGVLYPFTAAGSMAYRATGGDYLTELLKGAAYQVLGMKSDGTIPQWMAMLLWHQGGASAATNWMNAGTTKTIPTKSIRVRGIKTVSVSGGTGTVSVSYGSPTPFAYRPLLSQPMINASIGIYTARTTNDSVNGFDIVVNKLDGGSASVDVGWEAEGEPA